MSHEAATPGVLRAHRGLAAVIRALLGARPVRDRKGAIEEALVGVGYSHAWLEQAGEEDARALPEQDAFRAFCRAARAAPSTAARELGCSAGIACLALPLAAGATPLGTLYLGAPEADGFAAGERDALGLLQSEIAQLWAELELRGRAERESHESHLREERVQALLRDSSDVLFTVSPDLTIGYVSPSSHNALGRTPEALAGTCALAIIHPDDVERVRVQLGEVIDSPGARATAELRLRRADGDYTPFETIATSRLGDPLIGAIVLDARDISERKRAEAARREAEEQLRHAQKMQAIGRLAGGMAHDFNNFLTVILTVAEEMRDTLTPGDQLYADAAEITEATERAATLTRQLLTFARRSIGERGVIDLNHSIRELGRMLGRILGEDVKVELALGNGQMVVGLGADQADQILMNLVVNARDAMPTGGLLRIETRDELLLAGGTAGSLPPPGEYVVLVVSDTGVGMPPDVRAHIFEPFFTTKRPGEGTGLGLATVWAIAQRAGGGVRVRSEVGQGTRFEIYLPRGVRHIVEGAPLESPNGTELSGKVLLVEDDTAVRRVIRRALERHGFTVDEAIDGAEGLARFASEPAAFDLVFTDLVMPGMGGRELGMRVRHLRSDVAVLFMSGYTGDESEAGAASETPVLAKPFTVRDMLQQIARVMYRRAG